MAKKNLSRREFLKGAATSAVGVAALGFMGGSAFAEETSDAMSVFTPGTYTSTATGVGDITVTMTFDATSITDVQLDLSGETATIGGAAGDTLVEQILSAQSAEIDGVSGATITSDAVKTAAADCVNQAMGIETVVEEEVEGARVKGYSGPGDWLGTAPEITPDEVVECAIAIVGAGHAGVQAALAATQDGCADVVILEKQTAEIFDWYGQDIAAYNAKIALENGYAEYDLGEICDEYVKRAGGRCHPDIIRQFVQNCGPMLDNMLEVAQEVDENKEAFTALDGVAGTVLETNINTLEKAMYVYDNSTDGKLFIQTNMDADKILAGEDPYDSMNKTNYPINTGTRTWAATVCFAGQFNPEPIQGVSANSCLRYIESACLAKAISLGASIKFNAPAQVLVQDDEGNVTGVIAKVDDKYIQYNTSKGVILAGGGYAGNADMSWALLNEYMEENERFDGEKDAFYSFMGGRDGSAIKLGCWAGGYVDPAPRGTMILGGGVTSPWGTNSCMWLNSKGKRFCNEGNALGSNRAAWLQESGMAVMIVDKNWVRAACGSGMEHSGPDFGRPQMWIDVAEGMESDPDENGQISILTGTIQERGTCKMYKADTLDEVLALCGYDAETIEVAKESIERYNEFCHNGSDLDYGKGADALVAVEEGPFYGIAGSLGMGSASPSMVTMSGLVTNENFNVRTGDGGCIKGLYVAGNSMGGRYGLGYQCPSAGNSIGMATTNGYCAGKIVAEL